VSYSVGLTVNGRILVLINLFSLLLLTYYHILFEGDFFHDSCMHINCYVKTSKKRYIRKSDLLKYKQRISNEFKKSQLMFFCSVYSNSKN